MVALGLVLRSPDVLFVDPVVIAMIGGLVDRSEEVDCLSRVSVIPCARATLIGDRPWGHRLSMRPATLQNRLELVCVVSGKTISYGLNELSVRSSGSFMKLR